MHQDRLNYLYQRYINGTCSEEELAELRAVLKNSDQEENLYKLLDATWDNLDEKELKDISPIKAESIFQKIVSGNTTRQKSNLWLRVAATVTILLSFTLGFYLLYTNSQSGNTNNIAYTQSQELPESNTVEILPGKNNAILTLADGRQVVLTDTDTGHLATQDNVDIKLLRDGQLVYSVKGNQQNQKAQLNTINTPRGGQYKITLPDGSKVWLNAESSLQYPVHFTGNERRVDMTGEAYFEIAHNKDMPFKVFSNDVEIKVLGTHFNVMAYANENTVKTTLLEGSVNVNNHLLKPGQQARLNRKTSQISIAAVDTEEAVAWKNGMFMFQNENIESIMRKISRWYDVEVEFADNTITNKKFGGSISKYESVSEVLGIMELTGVIHFDVEGRKIVVTQKL